MKIKFGFYLLVAFTVIFSSCGKDDDCDATSLSTAIVGEWDLNANGSNMGSAEFRSDGTLVDEDDVLFSGEINGVVLDEKSYTVSGDSLITLRIESGSNFLTADLSVTGYDCDEIRIDIFSTPATLNRR